MSFYRDISIGDVVPLDRRRKPLSGACAPSWFVLTTGRQRRDMMSAKAWLEANGATECWFPEETRRVNRRRGNRVFREQVDIPLVPGVVFMLTEATPQWDILLDRKRIRPLMVAGLPVVVSESVMADMATVPARIEALRKEADARRAAEAEAKRLHEGDEAVFVIGPFRGQVVKVSEISGSECVVLVGPVKVRSDISALDKAG